MRFFSAADLRLKFFLLFILCFCAGVYAQERQIDSLKQELKTTVNDTTRIKVLAWLTDMCEPSTIMPYADSAVQLCEKAIAEKREPRTFYIRNLANVLSNIGYHYSKQGNTVKALEYYQQSLKLYEDVKDRKMSAILLNNMAFIYHNEGYVSRALEYYYKNLKVQEEIGDTLGGAYSMNNIGYVYMNLQDYPKALECYNKSLKMYEAIHFKKGIAMVLHNIGLVYNYEKDVPKSLDYFLRSYAINEEIKDH